MQLIYQNNKNNENNIFKSKIKEIHETFKEKDS